MSRVPSFSIAKRLGLIVGSAVIGAVVIAGAALFHERDLLLEARRVSVRQAVEVARGLVVDAHDQFKRGTLDEAQARLRAIEGLKALRYSGKEYFWVNDMQPRMVMHPTNPKLDGQTLADYKDPSGKRLFVEFVDVVRSQGGGFVEYLWPRPGNTEPVPKVSYVSGFPPWDWVIGSGVYLDDVDAQILDTGKRFALGTLVMAGVLGAIGFLNARAIMGELGGEPRYAAELTQRIAAGDLGVPIELARGGESSLLGAMRGMRDGLSGIVHDVRHGADAVARTSIEIAQSNADLSQRTDQQAAALQQTSAAVAQLTSSVTVNVESAGQASALAHEASTSAQRGGDRVGHVHETMKQISASSRRISEIIGVVDGIAFQTNILALNAAVEAARAGEQGRGFAVVAAEVRSLARRSAEAAKEVKQLIGQSAECVERGAREVDEARHAVDGVVGSIQRVADIVERISAGSAEQSRSIAQFGQAVTRMGDATQRNAAAVEQGAATAAALNAQATQLVRVVSTFRFEPGAA